MSDPNIVRLVFDFNETVVGVAKDVPVNTLSDAQHEWTRKALLEEVEEFSEGYAQQDVVAMTDAIIDLIYFAVGTLKKMGLRDDQAIECFNRVHKANMTKRRGGKPTRGNFEEDAVKPAEFVSPEQAIFNVIFGEIT